MSDVEGNNVPFDKAQQKGETSRSNLDGQKKYEANINKFHLDTVQFCHPFSCLY